MNFKQLIRNPGPYFIKGLEILKNVFRTYFYKGQTVFCAICNWNGKYFFKGKCPNCGSLARTRLIPFSLLYFKLEYGRFKILHVAPNTNEFKYIKNNVTTLLQYDRLNIRPVKHINLVQDLTHLTLNDCTYDLVIAWHVLEHIPSDKAAISEVYRVLKKGGRFLVSVPIYPEGNNKTFEDMTIDYADFELIHGHYDHCRSCGLDYFERFEVAGFRTETLEIRALDPNTIVRFGLQKDHVVWCFTK